MYVNQYAILEFQTAVKKFAGISSTGIKGFCWGNAAVETFVVSLKLKLDLNTTEIGTRADPV
jgi:hypothetical protein